MQPHRPTHIVQFILSLWRLCLLCSIRRSIVPTPFMIRWQGSRHVYRASEGERWGGCEDTVKYPLPLPDSTSILCILYTIYPCVLLPPSKNSCPTSSLCREDSGRISTKLHVVCILLNEHYWSMYMMMKYRRIHQSVQNAILGSSKLSTWAIQAITRDHGRPRNQTTI